MIYKSSHPLSPNTTIVINNTSVDYTSISGFTIELTENEHDYATITIAGAPAASVTDFFNQAVYILLDSGVGRRQEFFGYVVGAEPVSRSEQGLVNNSFLQEMRLRCLGSSFVMKEVSSQVWDRPTLSNIVLELVQKYKFSASYPKDTFKPTRMTQANESDWAFLRRVVDTYGYSMSVHGTHLHIWDVAKATRRSPSYHVLTTPNVYTTEHPGAVMRFEAHLGHYASSGDKSRLNTTILDNQGNITTADAIRGELKDTRGVTYSVFNTPLKQNFQTLEEAERFVDSKQKHRPLFSASVEVTAGAGIVPGGIVNLTGYKGEFDGIWYVSNVVHKMSTNMYTTELEIQKSNKSSEDIGKGAVSVFQTPPIPTMYNNRWVTSSETIEEYA